MSDNEIPQVDALAFVLDLQPRLRAIYHEWEIADKNTRRDRLFVYALLRAAYGAGLLDRRDDALTAALRGLGYDLDHSKKGR